MLTGFLLSAAQSVRTLTLSSSETEARKVRSFQGRNSEGHLN